jgi:hypothetical protein
MYVKPQRIHIWLIAIVWAIVLLGCSKEEEPSIDISIEYYSNTGCTGVEAITTPNDGMQYILYNYSFDGEYFYDEEYNTTTFEPVRFKRCHQGRAIIELHITAIDLKGTKQKQSWYKN